MVILKICETLSQKKWLKFGCLNLYMIYLSPKRLNPTTVLESITLETTKHKQMKITAAVAMYCNSYLYSCNIIFLIMIIINFTFRCKHYINKRENTQRHQLAFYLVIHIITYWWCKFFSFGSYRAQKKLIWPGGCIWIVCVLIF